MKEYNFLFKPLFFIFSLLFATWLVIKIEKISPSDFGEKSATLKNHPIHSEVLREDKKYLHDLCNEFKAGKIDSVELSEKLTLFLISKKDYSIK